MGEVRLLVKEIGMCWHRKEIDLTYNKDGNNPQTGDLAQTRKGKDPWLESAYVSTESFIVLLTNLGFFYVVTRETWKWRFFRNGERKPWTRGIFDSVHQGRRGLRTRKRREALERQIPGLPEFISAKHGDAQKPITFEESLRKALWELNLETLKGHGLSKGST